MRLRWFGGCCFLRVVCDVVDVCLVFGAALVWWFGGLCGFGCSRVVGWVVLVVCYVLVLRWFGIMQLFGVFGDLVAVVLGFDGF